MRGDSKRSPIISTYTTGIPAAHIAGVKPAPRNVPLPELAVLGGVSIAAIAFASFWIESPEPGGHATATDIGASGSAARPAFDRALGPGFSPDLDGSKVPSPHFSTDRRSKSDLPALEEGSPWLGLVRTEVLPPRQLPPRFPSPVARSASEGAVTYAITAEVADTSAVAGCRDDCPGAVVDRARDALDDRSTNRHGLAADESVEMANEETAGLREDLSDVSSALIVDASPIGELLIDAAPASGSTFVDATAENVPAPLGQEDRNAVEGSDAPRRDGAEALPAGVVVANSVPPGPPEVQAADPRTAIAGHLERLEARYPSSPNQNTAVVEEATPARGEALSASGGTSPSFEFHPNEVAASGLIIEDDELVAIKLGELVSLFEGRLDRPLYVWMTSSASSSKFVTPKSLATAGIQANFDPETGRVVLSVDED